ncbi:MAG: hypothetical protein J1F10_06285 [Muribaculaceae bacterium]|nr:hypothetical protein [Muribaculaceae bacterium]
MNIWTNLILLLTSPVNGWKQIGKYNIPKDYLLSKLFAPLIGLVGISAFALFFYEQGVGIVSILQRAIIQIGGYYFGYNISSYILIAYSQNDNKAETNRIFVFCMYCYSLLMIFSIIENLIPPNMVIIFKILPLYVAFIIWKAAEYINIEMSESRFVLVFVLSVMLPYYILSILLNSLL